MIWEIRHVRRTGARKLCLLLVATTVLIAPPASGAAGAPSCGDGKHWVGAWAASPAGPSLIGSLAGRTVRTVLTPLGSGRRTRIVFSNRFGDEPMRITAASVARQRSGPALAAGSLRRLSFDGRRTVNIPPGRKTVSDPVSFRIRRLEPIAVSVQVSAGSTGAVTEHGSGRQTSFLAPAAAGDAATEASGRSFTESIETRLLVARVDVRRSKRADAVVAFGDSITDGVQATADDVDRAVRYPDFLARRLANRRAPRAPSVINAGIAGNRILSDGYIPAFGPSGISRLRRDVASAPGARTVIVLEGINDIGLSWATADQVIGGLETITGSLQDRGLHVLLGTLTPSGGSSSPGYNDPGRLAVRAAVNDWIRSQGLSDGFVDFDAALRDPAHPDRLLPKYDSGDGLHPSTAGYRAMAKAVPLGQLATGGCDPGGE